MTFVTQQLGGRWGERHQVDAGVREVWTWVGAQHFRNICTHMHTYTQV